jgi:hypothetical protein
MDGRTICSLDNIALWARPRQLANDNNDDTLVDARGPLNDDPTLNASDAEEAEWGW